MRQDLSCFLTGGPLALRCLVIESITYLPKLRKIFPQAKLTVITRYSEIPALPEFSDLSIDWQVFDYRQKKLPFADAAFDMIIAESALEYAYDPYNTFMDFSRKLTDVGTLYTSFINIRYHEILQGLKIGEFPIREQHLYAKKEVVKLLDDTLFKEIYFVPGEQDDNSGTAKYWEELGFANISQDLATAVWLVKASRSTAGVANLKGLYTPALRKELACILHRIEYDIDTAKNLARLKELCEANGIFYEYIADFVKEACFHKEQTLAKLKTILVL